MSESQQNIVILCFFTLLTFQWFLYNGIWLEQLLVAVSSYDEYLLMNMLDSSILAINLLKPQNDITSLTTYRSMGNFQRCKISRFYNISF